MRSMSRVWRKCKTLISISLTARVYNVDCELWRVRITLITAQWRVPFALLFDECQLVQLCGLLVWFSWVIAWSVLASLWSECCIAGCIAGCVISSCWPWTGLRQRSCFRKNKLRCAPQIGYLQQYKSCVLVLVSSVFFSNIKPANRKNISQFSLISHVSSKAISLLRNIQVQPW